MANNHQGSLEHGKNIVNELSKIVSKHKIRAAIKLQYRDLWPEPHFIHKDFRDRKDVKHVPRFLSTRLTDDEFIELLNHIKSKGILTMVTPFDEASVDKCIEHEVEIIKIASCSVTDWPLLEKIAVQNHPTIISTGGSDFADIDNVYTFFSKRVDNFAIMHCVGLYPCANEFMDLEVISRLKKRYPGITIGYSGHENPDNTDVIMVAAAKGAEIFEGHVGLETKEIKLNKYSKSPSQVEKWVSASLTAQIISGNSIEKSVTDTEQQSLLTLKRGVFAAKKIKKGEEIAMTNVYFAMPCIDSSHLDSSTFGMKKNTFQASRDYRPDEAINEKPISSEYDLNHNIARQAIHEVRGLLNEANIAVDFDSSWIEGADNIEISHHYGIAKFRETGMVLINEINREYCKKILIILPGQKHPEHLHKLKEETFQVLSGKIFVRINQGDPLEMTKGEKLLVKRGVRHEFWCEETAAIIEEISTTYYRNDSFYTDDYIMKLDPMERKTILKS
tara:strand:+ start:18 stop:1526 length:1509 start_codon:yes stop_codon:yes gene_type:complete